MIYTLDGELHLQDVPTPLLHKLIRELTVPNPKYTNALRLGRPTYNIPETVMLYEIRGKALVINLPGQPKAIAQTLEGLPTRTPPVQGIFAAVPYCIDLIGGPYLECDEAVCKAFRPKKSMKDERAAAKQHEG